MIKRRDYKNDCRITMACLGLLVSAVVAYLYFLNVSVVHVVIRQESLSDIKAIETEIAILESQYIEAQHTIASRIADLDGYHTETSKFFVSRGSSDLVVRNQ